MLHLYEAGERKELIALASSKTPSATSGPELTAAELGGLRERYLPRGLSTTHPLYVDPPPGAADAIEAQAFVHGPQRKLLLINKRNREIAVELPKECLGAAVEMIGNGSAEVTHHSANDPTLRLAPLSISVVTLKD